jgi:hypothetical protein
MTQVAFGVFDWIDRGTAPLHQLSSGRSATPADFNRNGRPTSIGTGGRHQSECPADIIGIRSHGARCGMHLPDRALDCALFRSMSWSGVRFPHRAVT